MTGTLRMIRPGTGTLPAQAKMDIEMRTTVPTHCSACASFCLPVRDLKLFADAAGQVVLDLTMPGNRGPRPIDGILPNGMRATLPLQHTTVLAQVALQMRQPHSAGASTISRSA